MNNFALCAIIGVLLVAGCGETKPPSPEAISVVSNLKRGDRLLVAQGRLAEVVQVLTVDDIGHGLKYITMETSRGRWQMNSQKLAAMVDETSPERMRACFIGQGKITSCATLLDSL